MRFLTFVLAFGFFRGMASNTNLQFGLESNTNRQFGLESNTNRQFGLVSNTNLQFGLESNTLFQSENSTESSYFFFSFKKASYEKSLVCNIFFI